MTPNQISPALVICRVFRYELATDLKTVLVTIQRGACAVEILEDRRAIVGNGHQSFMIGDLEHIVTHAIEADGEVAEPLGVVGVALENLSLNSFGRRIFV